MIGDQQDFISRIKAILPVGWFREEAPILDGVLAGIGWALSAAYDLVAYARNQCRIRTATDGFLDLIAFDYFGNGLPRKRQEMDDAYRTRILAALFPEKGTRRGLIRTLEVLTGRTPRVFEPARPADTGGYNTTGMAYGLAGAYGTLLMPNQAFVIAYRPTGQGIPNIAGYGVPQGAYSTPSQAMYANPSLIQGVVTDADIYAAIDAVKPAATTVWTQIQS